MPVSTDPPPFSRAGRLGAFLVVGSLVFGILCARATVEVLDPETSPPPGLISTRYLPEKPASRILDETGALSIEAAAELARKLGKVSESGVEIHTLILKAPPQAEIQTFGTDLVQRWTPPEAAIGALVLSLPSVSEEPFVFITSRMGEEVEIERLRELGIATLARAGSRGTPEPMAFGASLDLAEGLEEILARLLQTSNGTTEESGLGAGVAASPSDSPAPRDPEVVVTRFDTFLAGIDPRLMTILRYLGIGIAACAALGILAFVRYRRRPRFFPQVEYRRRFSAPYSGGNNARAGIAPEDSNTPLSHAQ